MAKGAGQDNDEGMEQKHETSSEPQDAIAHVASLELQDTAVVQVAVVRIANNRKMLGCSYDLTTFGIKSIVADGLLHQFNAEYPTMQVAIGDKILFVNGIRITSSELYDGAIADAEVSTIVFERFRLAAS